jgi:hypothetical protein
MKSPHLLVDVRDVDIAGDTNALNFDSDDTDGADGTDRTADKFTNNECPEHSLWLDDDDQRFCIMQSKQIRVD